MDWKILLVFILVEVSELVVSLNEANYKHGGLQITNWPSTIPTGPQHPQRINHRHSNGGGYQEISPTPWQGTQILSQNQQHLNLPRPQIVNTIPQQYFQPIQSQIVHRQEIPQQPTINFARHHQVFNTPQAYKELPLEIRPTGRIQQQQISSQQNVYNAATRGWTNGQELNQQNSNFGKPFNPVVGQYYTEPYANYGNNYAYGYPQAQTLVPVISNRGGRQAWLPQNQNQQVTNPVTYSQWPETSYSYAPTKDTQYINNPYAPVRDSRFIEEVSSSPDQLQPGYQSAKGALGDLNQALYDPGEKQTPLEVVPGLIEETIIKNEIIAAPVTYGDDFVIDISAYPGFLPTTNYGNEKFAPVDNAQEETIAYPKEVPDSDPVPKGETHKLRKDLETDISKLKTTVDKPIVWFRPDKNFWDKVTKGENSYDYVTFYDVNCHPQLIEKHTTVHHYPNGTEVVEYVETFWKSANDLNPQEVKSNRVVRNPSE